jgi:uncharacterized membrane protein
MKLSFWKINKNFRWSSPMPRTTGTIIFDCAFVLMLAVVWGIIIWLISRAPSTVPTHFGPSGQPDAWGSPTRHIIPLIIITVVALIMVVGAYFPKSTLNLPGYDKEKANARQHQLAAWLVRIMAAFMLVLMLLLALSAFVLTNHSIVPVIVLLGVMVAVCIVFSILMHRAK